jgi:hypothetical protein
MNMKYFTISHLERLKKTKYLNNRKIDKLVVTKKWRKEDVMCATKCLLQTARM